MGKEINTPKNTFALISFSGIIVFVCLYIVATLYYPGGSPINKHSIGFDWRHNYWCNLLDQNAINGAVNTAQPIAITALVVLAISLTCFWYVFPTYAITNNYIKKITQISGTIAMSIALLLPTSINHDAITTVASIFGLLATIGTFIGLYKMQWRTLLIVGLFNFLLVLLNNFLYYNPNYIHYLPVVQKISFASFLIWIGCINLKVYRFALINTASN